jgi:phosphohistidine phosphatase
MDLFLIRHGQSSSGKSLGRNLSQDGTNEKTLTAAGIAEIKRTGEVLKTLNIIPDAIVTSPLKHACQSAKIVDSILFANKRDPGGKPKKMKKKLKSVQIWNDLAPQGDRALVYKILARFKYDSKIFVIGHGPFLTKMAADIVSSSSSSNTLRRLRYSSTSSNPNLGYGDGNHRSIVLKRSGLARISITSLTPNLKGELRWLLTPMLLKEISLVKASKKERKKKNQKISQYSQIGSSSNFTTNSKTRLAVAAIYQ